jgi:hypothetical protein
VQDDDPAFVVVVDEILAELGSTCTALDVVVETCAVDEEDVVVETCAVDEEDDSFPPAPQPGCQL